MKVLLKSVQVFEYLNYVSDYGIMVEGGKVDFDVMIQCLCGVVSGMSKGIEFLMKKNKIDVIKGFGIIKVGKKVFVKVEDGIVSELSVDKGIIIVMGVWLCQFLNFMQDGEKIIGYCEVMSLK